MAACVRSPVDGSPGPDPHGLSQWGCDGGEGACTLMPRYCLFGDKA